MKRSILKIADRILDQMANILQQVDGVDPKCIARLSLDTDVMSCLRLSNLQLRLFKYLLTKHYPLSFDHLDAHQGRLPMKMLIAYIIVHTEDEMLYEWHNAAKVA